MKEVYNESYAYRERPHMTRSEYNQEYSEIEEIFNGEKKRCKQGIPFCVFFIVLNIPWVLYILCLFPRFLVPKFLVSYPTGDWKQDYSIHLFVAFGIGYLPTGGVILSYIKAKKHYKNRMKALKAKKAICISLGTYEADK